MTADALLTSAASSTALPLPRSTLFGRTEEVETLLDLLGSGARLVTVTGAGGIGKTRVALEAARQLRRPVEFVSLAGVEPDGLVSALVGALTPEAPAGRPPLQSIAERLAGTETAVVLDTFEHLLGVASHLGVLLNACPDLSLLVTSRSRLRLEGEQVLVLRALPGGAGGPAVAMFAERARAVGADRAADDPLLMAELCELLDGVPLAIELAAARTTMLTPQGLVSRLAPNENRQLLGLLTGGQTDVVGRHQNMRAAIEWSYVLLDPGAQRAFRSCGIFTGTFSLDAAEAVCGSEVLDAVAALVDLHLLEPAEDAPNSIRFRMLDSLREYALERLRAEGEYDTVQDRLVRWGVSFGQEAAAGLGSGAEGRWLECVAAELPNLSVVFSVLVATDREASAVLACQLAPFWVNRGPLSEGRRWLDAALDTPRPGQSLGEHMRAVTVAWSARMALDQGDLDTVASIDAARAVIAKARDTTETPGGVDDWLQVTEHLAYGLTLRDELAQADELTAEAIEIARRSGRGYWLAVFLQRRALSAQRRGNSELAHRYATEAIASAADIGYDRIVARAEMILAHLLAITAPAEAYKALRVNLDAHRAAGDRRGVVSAMSALGVGSSDMPTAAGWFRDALDESQRIGYWHGEAICVMGLAACAAQAGRSREAAILDGGLRPHMGVLKANLPPNYFSGYGKAMDPLAAAMGDDFERAASSAPMHWPKLRARARQLATDLGAGSGSDSTLSSTRSVARQRGPRHNLALTDREVEILGAIAEGRTNPQIAAALYLSPKTVMHHSSNIYRKLGVRGRAEAVAHAYHTGILERSQ
jgi:predicted ATPase/DNA-binding CsgD family transcriptional regulator